MALRALVAATALAVAAPALVAAGPATLVATDADLLPDAAQEAVGCDPIDPALCLFPFPNDAFTVEDDASDTGRRVAFLPTAMPRNGTDVTAGELGGEGKPVDPTEWNRNDGFSPGQAILTHVPGIDLHATWETQDRPHSGDVPLNEPGWFDHRDHIADIDLSLDPEAPIVIVNAETGELHPFWSELDQHPGSQTDAVVGATTQDRQALILRPAVNFEEGARYIVAMRSLKDADSTKLEPGAAFLAHREGEATGPRADHMQEVLETLERHDIGRKNLYLAWDFTVASERSLAERALTIRDDAFGRILGDTDLADRKVEGASPEFEIVESSEREDRWIDSHGDEKTQRVRRIEGRVTVPNYLDRPQHTESLVEPNPQIDPPAPGSRFFYGTDGPLGDALPQQNPAIPTVEVPFRCDVPLDVGPSYGTLYGHGLLGTRSQIGDVKWPRRFGFAGCAADWWGMSTGDLPTVAAILTDLSHFSSLPDRAQQGFLNFMFLGRAMVHPDGFVTDPAFQDDEDGSELLVVDRGEGTHLYYDGNSQGGIMGGPLVALSPDIHRGILGVTGANYSTLLNRSVDWEGAYGEAYYATYQDPLERQLGMQLIQMLWDRGESNGYAAHTTDDPYENTPAHDVMLQIAWADHQVTVHAAEVNAATVGAPVMEGLGEGRHWALDPFVERAAYPHEGSALVYWDSGNATPPNGNLPATHSRDPHGDPRNEPAAGWQEAHFLLTGWHVDVCDGGEYRTQRHPDNGGAPTCIEPAFPPGSDG